MVNGEWKTRGIHIKLMEFSSNWYIGGNLIFLSILLPLIPLARFAAYIFNWFSYQHHLPCLCVLGVHVNGISDLLFCQFVFTDSFFSGSHTQFDICIDSFRCSYILNTKHITHWALDTMNTQFYIYIRFIPCFHQKFIQRLPFTSLVYHPWYDVG